MPDPSVGQSAASDRWPQLLGTGAALTDAAARYHHEQIALAYAAGAVAAEAGLSRDDAHRVARRAVAAFLRHMEEAARGPLSSPADSDGGMDGPDGY